VIEHTYKLSSHTLDQERLLLGQNDQHRHLLRQLLSCDFVIRQQTLIVLSETKSLADHVYHSLEAMLEHIRLHHSLDERDVTYLTQCVLQDVQEDYLKISNQLMGRTFGGKPIYAKTLGQSRFVEALKQAVCVIAVGPAGTGKTYLSVVYAVNLLKKGEVKKIILTRPVVEAGENLGFLPGDLKEKIDPYLRPLYDALYELLGADQTEKYIEKGTIEIAPLAYMRGRTFDDAYVILDEAQNTTQGQMLMFLTRMGFNTRMVVTGDMTQSDVKVGSGLKHAVEVLKSIESIKFVQLTRMDIVRHPLVQRIIEAYANNL
jgi:phosphate starvation-inducible protein PhoH and related proteins